MASTQSKSSPLTFYLLYLLAVATIGPLLFGYHLAELNAPSEVITCAKKSIGQDAAAAAAATGKLSKVVNSWLTGNKAQETPDTSIHGLPQCIPMDPYQFGLVSSVFTLGGLVGALAAGPISSRFSSLKTMIYTAVVATIGPVFEAMAPSITVITLGRFISGLAAGATMVVIPIYISEIAPPSRRGLFGSFTQVMVNVGILITQVLGYFMSKGQMWRIILGVGGVIALAQGVGLILGGQESPKWMAHHGNRSRAKEALRKIRGPNADIDAEVAGWGCRGGLRDVEDEAETLLAHQEGLLNSPVEDDVVHAPTSSSTKNADRSSDQKTLSVFQVLVHQETSAAVVAVIAIMIAQQFTGINSIIMYGVSLLSDLLAANSALLNVAVSVLNVVITAAAAPLVDKIGRKTCLMMSISGMGTMSILLAIGIIRAIPVLSAIAVVLFVASFGLGLGPIPFILASELVGPEAVGATQSLALAASWIATFVVAQFFPVVNDALGKGQVYYIFAAFAILFGAFIVWWVPETKGKSNVDEVWGRVKDPSRDD